MTEKIIEIENRLELDGFKFFNKDSKDHKFIYYHNPKNSVFDLKFDYINDEWEILYCGKSKLKSKKKEIVSTSEISSVSFYDTNRMHHLFVKENNSIIELASL